MAHARARMRPEIVAGTGEGGLSGNGGPATDARMDTPYGLVRASSRDVWCSDAGNRRVRVIDAATGTIRTLAGG